MHRGNLRKKIAKGHEFAPAAPSLGQHALFDAICSLDFVPLLHEVLSPLLLFLFGATFAEGLRQTCGQRKWKEGKGLRTHAKGESSEKNR